MDAADPGFAIYIHWPFCAAKCPYCDFNSHVRDTVDQTVWAETLVRDLETQSRGIGPFPLRSVFFGGGTPSLMLPETVARVLGAVDDIWGISPETEISLEANPTSVEAERFKGFRAAGVNRVSMGVQALNDRDLKSLGRLHTADEAMTAFGIASEVFDRVSFDLIYARQNQSFDDWRQELSHALSLAVDHLSLYQLTIEQGTRFGALHSRGKLSGLPEDGLAADLYDLTQELCETAGYDAYEVSNHARPGAECAHNRVYWEYGHYLGIGPGAHGRRPAGIELEATAATRVPELWLDRVQEQGDGIEERRIIPPADQADEMLIMGLRLATGIDPARFEALAGISLDPGVISDLITQELLEDRKDRVVATQAGRRVLNRVIFELLRDGAE